jgi:hypothetical protein
MITHAPSTTAETGLTPAQWDRLRVWMASHRAEIAAAGDMTCVISLAMRSKHAGGSGLTNIGGRDLREMARLLRIELPSTFNPR